MGGKAKNFSPVWIFPGADAPDDRAEPSPYTPIDFDAAEDDRRNHEQLQAGGSMRIHQREAGGPQNASETTEQSTEKKCAKDDAIFSDTDDLRRVRIAPNRLDLAGLSRKT